MKENILVGFKERVSITHLVWFLSVIRFVSVLHSCFTKSASKSNPASFSNQIKVSKCRGNDLMTDVRLLLAA